MKKAKNRPNPEHKTVEGLRPPPNDNEETVLYPMVGTTAASPPLEEGKEEGTAAGNLAVAELAPTTVKGICIPLMPSQQQQPLEGKDRKDSATGEEGGIHLLLDFERNQW